MNFQPIKDVSEYKRLKQTIRDRFEIDRTWDQTLFKEQTKKYKPWLSSQKVLSATIQDVANKIVGSQNEGQAALQPLLQPLLPILQNMQRAQLAAPGQSALPLTISPSQYATPQTSLMGRAGIRSRFHITHTFTDCPRINSPKYN